MDESTILRALLAAVCDDYPQATIALAQFTRGDVRTLSVDVGGAAVTHEAMRDAVALALAYRPR